MEAIDALHPSDQILSDYGLGKLDDESSRVVNEHLERCEACRQRVTGFSSDSFLARLREARKPSARSILGESLADGTVSLLQARLASSAPPPVETIPLGLAEHLDYEIKRELGRGGMGVVYLAHNTMMGRDEVLKVMGRGIMDRPHVLERFQREIRAVARLRHPNIVAAYSAFRIESGLVFAMEYVEGLDLARLVKAKGALPVVHACYFIHQAALGLQHAHERGMIHRDIKPHNLMLTHDGKARIVKVLDFGLAKATREEKADVGLTSEGQALGTPDYIAPEQIVNALDVDIRADIYSLGGTLYYLLAGRPPFRANSLYDMYQAHISRDIDPLNLLRPEVPAELAALVAKMMAKDPDRRFQTPGEVAEALKPFFRSGAARGKPEIPRLEQSLAPNSPPDEIERPVPEKLAIAPDSRLSESPQPEPRAKALSESVPEQQMVPTARFPLSSREFWTRKRMGASIAAAIASIGVFMAVLVVDLRLKIRGGTLVFTDLPEKAVVTVDGEVATVEWPGGNGPAMVSVPTGTHKIKVKWQGVEIVGQDVEIATHEKKPIQIRIEPGPAAVPLDSEGNAIDLFQPGSVWSGQDVDATFIVIDRDADRFQAVVFRPELLRVINGSIEGRRLRWRARDVKVITGTPAMDGETEIIGDTFTVTWPNPDGSFGGTIKWVLKKPVAVNSGKTPAADMFQPGSVWVSENGESIATILEREGERFKLIALGQGGDAIREINGTIKENRIRWLARDARVLSGPPAWNHDFELEGDQFSSPWFNLDGSLGGYTKHHLKKPAGVKVGSNPPGSIFNGRDLDGWTPYATGRPIDLKKIARAEKGEIVLNPEAMQAGVVSDQGYHDFALELEYRFPIGGEMTPWGGKISIWPDPSNGYRDQVECQIRPGEAGDLYSAAADRTLSGQNFRHHGRFHKILRRVNAESAIGEWNKVSIRCKANHIVFKINDQVVSEAESDQPINGRIFLMTQGCEIHFRNIVVKELH